MGSVDNSVYPKLTAHWKVVTVIAHLKTGSWSSNRAAPTMLILTKHNVVSFSEYMAGRSTWTTFLTFTKCFYNVLIVWLFAGMWVCLDCFDGAGAVKNGPNHKRTLSRIWYKSHILIKTVPIGGPSGFGPFYDLCCYDSSRWSSMYLTLSSLYVYMVSPKLTVAL